MLRRSSILLVSMLVVGCRGGVIYVDGGPLDERDAGRGMDAGMLPPPPMDGSMPPPMDGAMPPPPDGAPPPPRDGSMPPPPDGAMPPPRDGGMCSLTPATGMRCCFDDADCGTGPQGMPLRCYGATCTTGGDGQCVPPVPPGRCFGDLDCASGQTCEGGSLGCAECTATGCAPPTLGTCG
jgi:hypothetical protein